MTQHTKKTRMGVPYSEFELDCLDEADAKSDLVAKQNELDKAKEELDKYKKGWERVSVNLHKLISCVTEAESAEFIRKKSYLKIDYKIVYDHIRKVADEILGLDFSYTSPDYRATHPQGLQLSVNMGAPFDYNHFDVEGLRTCLKHRDETIAHQKKEILHMKEALHVSEKHASQARDLWQQQVVYTDLASVLPARYHEPVAEHLKLESPYDFQNVTKSQIYALTYLTTKQKEDLWGVCHR
jgi:hypothetical protein